MQFSARSTLWVRVLGKAAPYKTAYHLEYIGIYLQQKPHIVLSIVSRQLLGKWDVSLNLIYSANLWFNSKIVREACNNNVPVIMGILIQLAARPFLEDFICNSQICHVSLIWNAYTICQIWQNAFVVCVIHKVVHIYFKYLWQ